MVVPLPPASFVRGFLLRGVLLWGAIHLGAGLLGTLLNPPQLLLLLNPAQVLLVVLAVFAAARADDRVRGDDLLLGNLGVGSLAAPALSAGAALAMEVGVRVVASLA